jgi:histidinol phosphatase-like PHP family hydrolase
VAKPLYPGKDAGVAGGTISNGQLAELLARAADAEEGHRARALRRAGGAALRWPEEAAAILAAGRSLLDLRSVGPWVARRLTEWLKEPPAVPSPPELRSGFMTRTEARKVLAAEPDAPRLRGDLQMHTTWSDGAAPLDEMTGRAAALGHEYVAVTDHSVGLPIAGGMDEATLLRQGVEIDQANERLATSGFRILRSIEMNLSPAGEGDMDPDLLRDLDLVLGAFHSKLRTTEDQTDRYLAAVRNPTVHVLAHPRGRRWNARAGLRADWPRVFGAAATAGTAMEIDAFPDRQDLQVDLLEVARETGVWISIGTDAHHPEELEFLELGLAAAVRARVPTERILNLRSVDEVIAWAAAKQDPV